MRIMQCVFCCFECFKQFVCNFLYDDFYALDFYRNVHKSLFSSLLWYFLDKNFIRCRNKKYACFCFWSQFDVWCLCWSLYFVFFVMEEKSKKMIAEIDLVIRKHESTAESDFDKFSYSEKKHQKRNMNGTNMT